MPNTRSTPIAKLLAREPRGFVAAAALALALTATWLLEGTRSGAGLAAALTLLLTGVLLVGFVHAPDAPTNA